MRSGLLNECNVVKGIAPFMSTHSLQYNGATIQFDELGLVGRSLDTLSAASIDRLAEVTFSDGAKKVVGVEIKTQVTLNSGNEMMAKFKGTDPVQFVTFQQLLATPGVKKDYACQVCHHAACLRVPTMMLVYSRFGTHEITKIFVVTFDDLELESHLKSIEASFSKHKWFRNPALINFHCSCDDCCLLKDRTTLCPSVEARAALRHTLNEAIGYRNYLKARYFKAPKKPPTKSMSPFGNPIETEMEEEGDGVIEIEMEEEGKTVVEIEMEEEKENGDVSMSSGKEELEVERECDAPTCNPDDDPSRWLQYPREITFMKASHIVAWNW